MNILKKDLNNLFNRNDLKKNRGLWSFRSILSLWYAVLFGGYTGIVLIDFPHLIAKTSIYFFDIFGSENLIAKLLLVFYAILSPILLFGEKYNDPELKNFSFKDLLDGMKIANILFFSMYSIPYFAAMILFCLITRYFNFSVVIANLLMNFVYLNLFFLLTNIICLLLRNVFASFFSMLAINFGIAPLLFRYYHQISSNSRSMVWSNVISGKPITNIFSPALMALYSPGISFFRINRWIDLLFVSLYVILLLFINRRLIIRRSERKRRYWRAFLGACIIVIAVLAHAASFDIWGTDARYLPANRVSRYEIDVLYAQTYFGVDSTMAFRSEEAKRIIDEHISYCMSHPIDGNYLDRLYITTYPKGSFSFARVYNCDEKVRQRFLEDLFLTDEFQQQGIWLFKKDSVRSLIIGSSVIASKGTPLSDPFPDTNKLFDSYKKDVEEQSLEEYQSSEPIGYIDFLISFYPKTRRHLGFEIEEIFGTKYEPIRYPIFPFHRNTLAFLEEKNISLIQ